MDTAMETAIIVVPDLTESMEICILYWNNFVRNHNANGSPSPGEKSIEFGRNTWVFSVCCGIS